MQMALSALEAMKAGFAAARHSFNAASVTMPAAVAAHSEAARKDNQKLDSPSFAAVRPADAGEEQGQGALRR